MSGISAVLKTRNQLTDMAAVSEEFRPRSQRRPPPTISNKHLIWVRLKMADGLTREEMVAAYESWSRERGAAEGVDTEMMRRYEMANPIFMSVDGIMRYWNKRPAG
jgi:hypothetical protein